MENIIASMLKLEPINPNDLKIYIGNNLLFKNSLYDYFHNLNHIKNVSYPINYSNYNQISTDNNRTDNINDDKIDNDKMILNNINDGSSNNCSNESDSINNITYVLEKIIMDNKISFSDDNINYDSKNNSRDNSRDNFEINLVKNNYEDIIARDIIKTITNKKFTLSMIRTYMTRIMIGNSFYEFSDYHNGIIIILLIFLGDKKIFSKIFDTMINYMPFKVVDYVINNFSSILEDEIIDYLPQKYVYFERGMITLYKTYNSHYILTAYDQEYGHLGYLDCCKYKSLSIDDQNKLLYSLININISPDDIDEILHINMLSSNIPGQNIGSILLCAVTILALVLENKIIALFYDIYKSWLKSYYLKRGFNYVNHNIMYAIPEDIHNSLNCNIVFKFINKP